MVKTRLQSGAGYKGPVDAARAILKNEGVAGFYRGACFCLVLSWLRVVVSKTTTGTPATTTTASHPYIHTHNPRVACCCNPHPSSSRQAWAPTWQA